MMVFLCGLVMILGFRSKYNMYAFCPDFLQRIFFSYALLCSPSNLIQAEFGGQQGMKSVQAARRRRWKDPGLGTGKDIHIYIYVRGKTSRHGHLFM